MLRIIVSRAVITSLLILVISSVHASSVEESVVKIIAGENAGTGFVWEGQHGKYIATSLHTLAGAKSVYYNKVLSRFELEVYKIDKESDLALLRAKSGKIELPALKLGDIQPIQDRRYWIYGYPAGVSKIQGDSLEFSRGEHNIPMRDYLDSQIVKKITAIGYPQASLKLLRVSSGITPGHSGAPIIDPEDNNKVIGIGAGGLSNIGFQRVNWAVPALTYLPSLEEQGAKESTASMSVSKDARKFSVRTEEAAPPLESEQIKYYNIGRLPLEDLLQSVIEYDVDPEDQWFSQDELNSIRKDAKKNNYDLKAPIDIYQNTQTGAMVYVPAAIPRSSISIEDDNMLVFDAGRVRMHLQIIKGYSFAEALDRKNDFLTILDRKYGINGWSVDTRSEWTYDEPIHYPDKGYWENSIIKYKPEPGVHDRLSEADIYFSIDYNDDREYGNFLGIAVMGLDYENWIDGVDDELYFLVDAAAWVSGFIPN